MLALVHWVYGKPKQRIVANLVANSAASTPVRLNGTSVSLKLSLEFAVCLLVWGGGGRRGYGSGGRISSRLTIILRYRLKVLLADEAGGRVG